MLQHIHILRPGDRKDRPTSASARTKTRLSFTSSGVLTRSRLLALCSETALLASLLSGDVSILMDIYVVQVSRVKATLNKHPSHCTSSFYYFGMSCWILIGLCVIFSSYTFSAMPAGLRLSTVRPPRFVNVSTVVLVMNRCGKEPSRCASYSARYTPKGECFGSCFVLR